MFGTLLEVPITPAAGVLAVGVPAPSLFKMIDFFTNGNPIPTFAPDDTACKPFSGWGRGKDSTLGFVWELRAGVWTNCEEKSVGSCFKVRSRTFSSLVAEYLV
jgi:hypothetical protein